MIFSKKINKYNHLKYRRGYVISDKNIRPPNKNWKKFKINNYYIYFDPINETSYIEKRNHCIFVLGTIIDISNGGLNREEILNNLLNKLFKSKNDFYDYLDHLSGRYLILFCDGIDCYVLNDATGMRSVFYSRKKTIIGSHCELVQEYVQSDLSTIVDREWFGKYTNYHLPGHYTPYQDIFFLTPNTKLRLSDKKIIRFFPRKPLEVTNVNHSAELISEYVNNQLTNLVNMNKKLLLSLSSGIDSRLSLAFTKKFLDKFTFFTYYKRGSGPLSKGEKTLQVDVEQVSDLATQLNLNHHIITLSTNKLDEKIPRDFIEIMRKNTFTHHSFELAKIYCEKFGDEYLHIRSNVPEVGRLSYKPTRNKYKKFNLESMVHAYSYKALNDDKVKKAFSNFCNDTQFDKIFNYDPFNMMYWEYRMGVWQSQVLLESDVAHDTFSYFNARKILSLFLSIPITDRKNNKLFYAIISRNWPVINYWKINEVGTMDDVFDREIDNDGHTLKNLKLESGSIYEKNRKNQIQYSIKDKKAKFFMDKSNPKKGDYVKAELELNTEKNKSYHAILQVRSPYENKKYKGRLSYQILLNDEILAEEDISCWKESNQIQIKWISKQQKDNIAVRVIAEKDCEDWGWGRAATIFIEKLVLRQDAHDEQLSVFASSPFTKIFKETI